MTTKTLQLRSAGINRPVVARRRPRLSRPRKIFLAAQLTHIAAFYALIGEKVDTLILILSGVTCMVLYSFFLISEYRRSDAKLSPFLFYIAASIFRLGTGVIYLASVHAFGEERVFYVGWHNVTAWLMHGHLIAMVGDWFFILGYVLFDSDRRRNHNKTDTKPGVSLSTVYLAGLVMVVLAALCRVLTANQSLGGFGQLLGYFVDYGVPAGVYLMFLSVYRSRSGFFAFKTHLALAIFLTNIFISLFSYMKTDIFIALLPIVLVGMEIGQDRIRRRGVKAILMPALLVMLVSYLFLFLFSTYSELRRPAFHERGLVSAQQIWQHEGAIPALPYLGQALVAAIPGTREFAEVHRFPDSGAWHMIRRMSVTDYTAWAYRQVDEAGLKEGSFLYDLIVAITPRIFWPEKPSVSPGAEFAAFLEQPATTATALTMQGSYYWWGGWVGLAVGTFLTGLGFALVWRLVAKDSSFNPIAALVMLALFYEGFHWFESAFLGAFPFYLYVLIVFMPLMIAVRKMMQRKRSIRARQKMVPVHYSMRP